MRNLLEVRGGRPRERRHEELRERMAATLERLCTESGTLAPTGAAARRASPASRARTRRRGR